MLFAVFPHSWRTPMPFSRRDFLATTVLGSLSLGFQQENKEQHSQARNTKTASLVAKAVMDQTGHVMLVGEGAERFAVAQGFPRENLLTENTRKIWLLWKETHSDWWGPGLSDPNWKKRILPATPKSEKWRQKIKH